MYEMFKGDCLEVMKQIPDGSVDMILCDPPYGTTACKWDTVIPFDAMWREVKRVARSNTAILLFGSEPFSSYLRISNIRDYKHDLYWKKEKPTNFFQLKKRVGKVTETISVFYEKQPKYFPQKVAYKGNIIRNRPKGVHKSITAGIGKQVTPYVDDGTRYPIDVLEFNREPLGSTIHPTQKPVSLIEWLIKSYSEVNDTILDFTMGSGTTGVACANTGRKFIGIEMDDKYFEIAKERVSSAYENKGA